MIERRQILKKTFINFQHNFKDILFFEILYKLIAMIFFIPINDFILRRSIFYTGQLHLSNKDVLRFSITPLGMIGLLLMIIFSFIGIFIEMFILMKFAKRSHEKHEVNVFSDSLHMIKRLFKKINFYLIACVILSGLMGTLTGVGLYNSLIRELKLPSLMISTLSVSLIGSFIILFFIILFLFFSMRWFLTIPVFVIEDVPFKSALHRSVQLYKANKLTVITYLSGWFVTNLLFKSILLLAYLLLGSLIFSIPLFHSKLFIMLYLIIFMIGYLLLSLITLPLFLSYLAELYYSCMPTDMNKREYSDSVDLPYPYLSHPKSKVLKTLFVLMFCMMIGLSTSSIWLSLGKNTTQITAHRGSSLKAPENTYASVARAIEDEVAYAEIDATLTKDGHVVLFHDKTLKRMTGSKKKIKDLTLAQLQEIDIGSHFNSSFNEERIPTLEEILLLSKGKIKLNIELKTYGADNDLPLKVANLIKKYNMEEDVIVSSMDYSAAERFKSYAPLVDVGYIITSDLHDLNSLNVDFVSIEYSYLSKELLYAMHALGKDVHVWTVNQVPKATRAALLGVDNIITDHVDDVKLIIKNESNQNQPLIVMLYDGVSSIIRYLKV